jgi:hypothetical protein
MKREPNRPERWTDGSHPAQKQPATSSWWLNLSRDELEVKAKREANRMDAGRYGAYDRPSGHWD